MKIATLDGAVSVTEIKPFAEMSRSINNLIASSLADAIRNGL